MRGPQPPRLAAWLADRILQPEDAQRLLGDLDRLVAPLAEHLDGVLDARSVLPEVVRALLVPAERAEQIALVLRPAAHRGTDAFMSHM